MGAVEIPVEITDGIMPGVVSIPHGWGHGGAGADMAVAGRHAGVNTNLLADGSMMDPLSGNAVLNGIPVTVEALVPAGVTPLRGRDRPRREKPGRVASSRHPQDEPIIPSWRA